MSDDNSEGSDRNVDLGSTRGFGSNLEESNLSGSDSDSDPDDEPNQGLFDDLLSGEPIFENKEVLRPSYTPHELPHRSDQINKMATILVAALRGETPSNILIYGKTGTGKTASAKFVSKELESTSKKYSVPCEVEYINCEVTDTQYRVLAQLANKFIEENERVIETQIDSLEALLDDLDEYDDTITSDESDPDSETTASDVPGDDSFVDDGVAETTEPNFDANSSTDLESGESEPVNRVDLSTGDTVDLTSSESDSPVETGGSDTVVDDDRSSAGSETEGDTDRSHDDDYEHPLADTPFSSAADVEDRIASLEADRESFEEVPMTGWPTDRVYSVFFDAVDYSERVVVIMLDEIDKLVEKSGDDTLYNLSRMNSELQNSRVSIIGISNDLKFTDFLDPRVKSSLGEEEIVFPPYDANQLRDILQHRSEVAFKGDALSPDVIPLCAAFAAQEHGDARRALDLLRTAGELAERAQAETIVEEHVRQAQDKIELDRVVEVVRTLPTQSKLVLFAIILLEKNGVHSINTGEVFNIYKRLCEEIDADVLTQRRVTDLISELDMLGIVNAVVVSKGRYGRTKEISLSVPIEETEAVLLSDSRLSDIDDVQPFVQARFDN
ncbi:ORC1-type DNA replication protein [Natronoglomus mannanivorans]|uniref:ORC1-type DNA replication protein n=1 Tax=Natronoglomus mannanivorans TaxID=2979990 RepID=A0AAP2Z245_9EURY|nr:AAA family ATPase [Halobacteria archaeon AArc-xg1-1]